MHAHDWTLLDEPSGAQDWACSECDATSATCIVDERGQHPTGTSLLICEPCLNGERRVLADIATAVGQIEIAAPSPLRAIRYDRDRIHGGDGPGLPLLVAPDAESLGLVVDVLWSWVGAWTERSGDAQNVGPAEYLAGHLMWAAHHRDEAGWDDFRREVRQLRHRARQAAGLLPQREPAPCIYCGGSVVRDWADEAWRANPDGLSDVLRCTRCGMVWGDLSLWRQATRQHLRDLPNNNPDALVTLDGARAIWPDIPRQTMDAWVARGELAAAGTDDRGEPLFCVKDLDDLAWRRADTRRPGRRARDAGSAC